MAFRLRKDLDTVQHRDLGVKRVLQRILLIFLFRYVKGDLQTRLAPIPGNQLVLQKIMTRKLPVKYLPCIEFIVAKLGICAETARRAPALQHLIALASADVRADSEKCLCRLIDKNHLVCIYIRDINQLRELVKQCEHIKIHGVHISPTAA